MSDDIWVVEKDQVMVEGEELIFSVQFLWATTVASSETKCYKNGAEYSSTAPSGSNSESGDTVTCKKVTAHLALTVTLTEKRRKLCLEGENDR